MKTIRQVFRNQPSHWVGDGFPVRSLFSYQQGAEFDPFLLLDYAGPQDFAPTTARRGVGEHPHRGFETVTIVYQGELEHRDSSGSHGVIGAGDVQWMTAAAGVIHEEFHSEQFSRNGGTLEMIQLWVNLPADKKMSSPRYQEILHSQIPKVVLPNNAGEFRVIAGELFGTRGPAQTFTPIKIWDGYLNAGGHARFELTEGHTLIVVVRTGDIHVNNQPLVARELALFERQGTILELQADSQVRVAILSGQPLSEPIVGYGPFVMNTRQEIEQAIADFQAGTLHQVD